MLSAFLCSILFHDFINLKHATDNLMSLFGAQQWSGKREQIFVVVFISVKGGFPVKTNLPDCDIDTVE